MKAKGVANHGDGGGDRPNWTNQFNRRTSPDRCDATPESFSPSRLCVSSGPTQGAADSSRLGHPVPYPILSRAVRKRLWLPLIPSLLRRPLHLRCMQSPGQRERSQTRRERQDACMPWSRPDRRVNLSSSLGGLRLEEVGARQRCQLGECVFEFQGAPARPSWFRRR